MVLGCNALYACPATRNIRRSEQRFNKSFLFNVTCMFVFSGINWTGLELFNEKILTYSVRIQTCKWRVIGFNRQRKLYNADKETLSVEYKTNILLYFCGLAFNNAQTQHVAIEFPIYIFILRKPMKNWALSVRYIPYFTLWLI